MEFEVSKNRGKIDILAADDNPKGTYKLFVQCGSSYSLAYEGHIGCLADILMSNSLTTDALRSGMNAFFVVHPTDLDHPGLVS